MPIHEKYNRLMMDHRHTAIPHGIPDEAISDIMEAYYEESSQLLNQVLDMFDYDAYASEEDRRFLVAQSLGILTTTLANIMAALEREGWKASTLRATLGSAKVDVESLNNAKIVAKEVVNALRKDLRDASPG